MGDAVTARNKEQTYVIDGRHEHEAMQTAEKLELLHKTK